MKKKILCATGLLSLAIAACVQVSDAHAIKKCVKFKSGQIAFAHHTNRADAQIATLRGLVRATRTRYNQGYRPNPSSRDINCRPVRTGNQEVKYICRYNLTMCKQR